MLGTLIDSLVASGYEPVLVSELAGITRDEAMPPLESRTIWARIVDIVSFGFIGLAEWGLYWVFFACVILGVARLRVHHHARGRPARPRAPARARRRVRAAGERHRPGIPRGAGDRPHRRSRC